VATRSTAAVKAFSIKESNYEVVPVQTSQEQYLLYHSMLLFFQNGGGPCYIVSVGHYDEAVDAGDESDLC
jgi:hypothetical protein